MVKRLKILSGVPLWKGAGFELWDAIVAGYNVDQALMYSFKRLAAFWAIGETVSQVALPAGAFNQITAVTVQFDLHGHILLFFNCSS